MFTFVKLSDSHFSIPLKYNWCLQVSDALTLIDYEQTVMAPYQTKVFQDCFNSKEFQYLANLPGSLKHHALEKTSWPILIKLEQEGGGLIERFVEFFSLASETRMRMLCSYGTIFIQQSRGCFGKTSTHCITDLRQSETLIWPENDSIELFKWPRGKHWYAKVGDIDVVWDGQGKWNTKEAAQQAAEYFRSNCRKDKDNA